jgi:RNA polymerase sigma-70 factor (ECF subfamily)
VNETRTSLLRRLGDLSDQHSWGEFVGLYEPLLLRYVCRQGLAAGEAEDVVQTIFVNLLRHLPEFTLDRDRGRFRTWLYRVARNAVIDWQRRRGSRRRVEDERRRSFREIAPEPDTDWDKLHHQRILEFVLEKVKQQTVPSTWACFEQHLLRGRSGAAVGAELGMPPNTVYVNASRVLARIREQCAAYREEFGDE